MLVNLRILDLLKLLDAVLGDVVEANAIKSVFSDHATSGALAISSTKVSLGIVSFGISVVCISVLSSIGWH